MVLGADNITMHTSPNKIIGIKRDHPELSPQQLKDSIKSLYDPLAVYESPKGGYVVLTEMFDSNSNPIMVAVHLNKSKGFYKVNSVASVYGRNNAENYFGKLTKLYENDLKSLDSSFESTMSQEPTNSSIINILKKSDIANKYGDKFLHVFNLPHIFIKIAHKSEVLNENEYN